MMILCTRLQEATSRQFVLFCLMLKTETLYFSGLQGLQNHQTVDITI